MIISHTHTHTLTRIKEFWRLSHKIYVIFRARACGARALILRALYLSGTASRLGMALRVESDGYHCRIPRFTQRGKLRKRPCCKFVQRSVFAICQMISQRRAPSPLPHSPLGQLSVELVLPRPPHELGHVVVLLP